MEEILVYILQTYFFEISNYNVKNHPTFNVVFVENSYLGRIQNNKPMTQSKSNTAIRIALG